MESSRSGIPFEDMCTPDPALSLPLCGKDSGDPVQCSPLGLSAALLVNVKSNARSLVPKQFLNGLHTFTLLAQEAGQRVPEDMPGHPLGNAGLDRGRLNVIL